MTLGVFVINQTLEKMKICHQSVSENIFKSDS